MRGPPIGTRIWPGQTSHRRMEKHACIGARGISRGGEVGNKICYDSKLAHNRHEATELDDACAQMTRDCHD